MEHLRVYAKILLLVLTLSQVRGNPMFFWSQQEPDCSQQSNSDNNNYQNYQQSPYQSYQVPSYQAPSYQDSSYQGAAYQGPSYQETLQAMIADTLRALCDIVQSTVQASKQEIATLARMFVKKSSQSNCESDDTPEEEYNVQPSEQTYNNPPELQTVSVIETDTSTSTSKPNLLLQKNNESVAISDVDDRNSTSLVSTSLKATALNATAVSTTTTKPANSTTEKTNTEVTKGTVSPSGAQNSNKTVAENTTLTS